MNEELVKQLASLYDSRKRLLKINRQSLRIAQKDNVQTWDLRINIDYQDDLYDFILNKINNEILTIESEL